MLFPLTAFLPPPFSLILYLNPDSVMSKPSEISSKVFKFFSVSSFCLCTADSLRELKESSALKLVAISPILEILMTFISSPCSIALTTSIPLITLPKTVCLLSNHAVGT